MSGTISNPLATKGIVTRKEKGAPLTHDEMDMNLMIAAFSPIIYATLTENMAGATEIVKKIIEVGFSETPEPLPISNQYAYLVATKGGILIEGNTNINFWVMSADILSDNGYFYAANGTNFTAPCDKLYFADTPCHIYPNGVDYSYYIILAATDEDAQPPFAVSAANDFPAQNSTFGICGDAVVGNSGSFESSMFFDFMLTSSDTSIINTYIGKEGIGFKFVRQGTATLTYSFSPKNTNSWKTIFSIPITVYKQNRFDSFMED